MLPEFFFRKDVVHPRRFKKISVIVQIIVIVEVVIFSSDIPICLALPRGQMPLILPRLSTLTQPLGPGETPVV